MKNFNYFVGIDVSKATLDVSVIKDGEQIFYQKIENKANVIVKLLKTLKIEYNVNLATSLFCMEHTGVYTSIILSTLHEKRQVIWLESANQIKRSIGIQRGKSDKVDAKRIAYYAYKNFDKLKEWNPPSDHIQKLKLFVSIRKRLIKTEIALKKPLNELNFLSIEQQNILKNGYNLTLDAIKKDLKKIDQDILQIIKENENLHHLFKLVISVKGIGKVTAIQMIVTTNEFKTITDAKKYACYAGIAPFEHLSGSSIRGRTRVSDLADKTTKTYLHMASLAAIREKGEMQDYFLRKVEQGKNKMSILNAVRNKLIHRVFSCVRNNRLYEPILN